MILPKLSLSGPGGFREEMRNPVTTLIKLRVQELWKTEPKSKVLNHLTEGRPGQEVIWIPEIFFLWNPESKFRLQRIRIQYLESKAVLDYLTWGD